MPDEPLVPIVPVKPAAMAIAAAMRQAAVDLPADLPRGVTVSARATAEAGQVVVVARAKHADLGVLWEQRYDGTGRRLEAFATVRLGGR